MVNTNLFGVENAELIEVEDSQLIDSGVANEEDQNKENKEGQPPVTKSKLLSGFNEAKEIEIDEEESEEENVVPEEGIVTETSNSGSEDIGDVLQALVTDFKSEGFLPDIDETELASITDYDGLSSAFSKQLNVTFETWKNNFEESLNSNSKGLLKHLQNNGKLEDFIEVYTDSVTNIKFDDLEDNENLQRQVLHKLYTKVNKFSDEKATKLISKLVDLEEDAKEAYKELEVFEEESKKKLEEQTKLKVLEEKKAVEKYNADLKKGVYDINEFIPGQKVTEKDKTEVFNLIPKTLEKINNNKEKYIPILAYLDKYGILDKGIGDILTKKAVSAGTKNLMNVLTGKKTPKVDRTEDYDSIMSFAKRK